MRTGTTLVELAIVLTLVAIVLAIGLPRWRAYLDREAVTVAADRAAATLDEARLSAVRSGAPATVRVDERRGSLTVTVGRDTLATLPLGTLHSITLRASRDSITFAPTGFGYGAANTQLVIVRRRAAETVSVSRLGRVRR